MSRYIAITFGPITRVISMAQTTRGMWAASYLFSYLAKESIRPFAKRKFLLPFINEEMFNKTFRGAGVFPDRYIFESENGDFELLKSHIDEVFSSIAGNLKKNDNENIDDIKKYLLQRFKVYFIEQERDNLDERTFISHCEQTLSLLEEQDSYIPSVVDGHDYIIRLLNGGISGMQFLMDDAGIGKFKSIVEISSENGTPVSYKDDDPTKKKVYERYIAIVYADGDSMSGALSKVPTSQLSNALFEFNKVAIKAINDFDGQPVYIGGDDLFFFAPIFHEGKSIFSLLQTLDEAFHKSLQDKNISGPTISFGVSITYYKYPMSEAVACSDKLLKGAKGYNIPDHGNFKEMHYRMKNNILFSIQKHSGQTRAALLHKGFSSTVTLFNKMDNDYSGVSDSDSGEGNKMLSSIMHNLREHEPILVNAIHDKELLINYFDNYYNESPHESYKNFFNELSNLIHSACEEYGDPKAALDLTYALLQFIHLVNLKRDE